MADNNYTLGRGEVHFGQYKPSTQIPRGERYLGNTPELGFTAEQENLDHYSSDRGVRIKDESVLLQLDYAGSFITDNISPENIAAFFLGDSLTTTVTAATGVAFTLTEIEQGLTYQLGTTDTTPSGARKIAAFTITTPAACVEGVDYVVDLELGRVTILEGSTKLTDGLASVVGTYNVEASTRNRVISKANTIEGSLRYIAKNPAGDNIDYFMPWVKLTPNGDFQLKGDEWQQLPFTLEILKKGSLESIYMDGRPYTP
jgi:hypothetical protein